MDEAEVDGEPMSVHVKMATLEERMNTMAAQNEALKSDVNASFALLREDLAKRDADMKIEIASSAAKAAERDADMKIEIANSAAKAAERDKGNQRWLVGILFAVVLLIITTAASVVIRFWGAAPGS